jgi:hypothetical protein
MLMLMVVGRERCWVVGWVDGQLVKADVVVGGEGGGGMVVVVGIVDGEVIEVAVDVGVGVAAELANVMSVDGSTVPRLADDAILQP